MTDLETMKNELGDIESEIASLENARDQLEDRIERWREAEKIESVVLAALNKNYNQWCNRSYLAKTIRWDETEFEDADETERKYRAAAACDMLFEKGIIQRKEVGRDWENDPIYDYRITDTETRDMFEEGGK